MDANLTIVHKIFVLIHVTYCVSRRKKYIFYEVSDERRPIILRKMEQNCKEFRQWIFLQLLESLHFKSFWRVFQDVGKFYTIFEEILKSLNSMEVSWGSKL